MASGRILDGETGTVGNRVGIRGLWSDLIGHNRSNAEMNNSQRVKLCGVLLDSSLAISSQRRNSSFTPDYCVFSLVWDMEINSVVKLNVYIRYFPYKNSA